MSKLRSSNKGRTSRPSPAWEATGVDRLYKRVGQRKISYIYKHPDGRSETLATAATGDRAASADAWKLAQIKAHDIQQGHVVADSVAAGIERFESEIDPGYFLDQSKNGKSDRKATYNNLRAFFGKMNPQAMRQVHGYQYLDARAANNAPARANKEMALMSTICHQFVKWDLIERNPFLGMTRNKVDTQTRDVSRRQVLRFYLWAVRQRLNYRTMGCAAMFAYLTGYRAAEVRPFKKSGLSTEGVSVISAKRKKGERVVQKLREWSPRLRCVVARALERDDAGRREYLFAPSKRSACYSRSGWGASWQDAMNAWIRSQDPAITEADLVTDHPLYFALQDVRPMAITAKLNQRAQDAYDFAAHTNPATTHKNYDRRRVKRASATE
ncbi:hypothetical protein [Achromobacter xylosoxidans]|uniref:hypothetical protein n=1 Tax=Alcaligenes xylosoxydans xylosoxydans TaxID=85698 RepID=UPI0018DC37CC|nr:hypothetical protein [Achromobacter xylosoxidans]